MRTLKGGSARKTENHCSKGIFVHYVCSGPQHVHAGAVRMQTLCTCRGCANADAVRMQALHAEAVCMQTLCACRRCAHAEAVQMQTLQQ